MVAIFGGYTLEKNLKTAAMWFFRDKIGEYNGNPRVTKMIDWKRWIKLKNSHATIRKRQTLSCEREALENIMSGKISGWRDREKWHMVCGLEKYCQ